MLIPAVHSGCEEMHDVRDGGQNLCLDLMSLSQCRESTQKSHLGKTNDIIFKYYSGKSEVSDIKGIKVQVNSTYI